MIVPILLLLTYLVPSFLFDFMFEFWQGFVPYYFEFIFVAVVAFIYRKKLKFEIFSESKIGKSILIYTVAGFLTLVFAKIFSTELPFDLKNRGVLIFLLFLGPLLEEFIFRFSLWHLIKKITKCEKTALYLTTCLFSLAHFKAVLIIKDPFLTFVVFQSLYTMILGRQLGERYLKRKSLTEVILLHSFYNAGFWIASMVFY